MKVGFLGLGQMGAPLAGHVLDKGYELFVYDPDEAAVARLTEKGARRGASPLDVANRAELVLACLPSPDVSHAVAFGSDGVAGGESIEIYVEMSTVGPRTIGSLAERFRGGRITMLDCPISGGQRGAIAGTVAAMMAGPRAAFERAEPVVGTFSSHVFHVGEVPGLGQVCKLVNNAISLTAATITAEALVIGTKAGMDPAVLLDVVNASTGRNSVTTNQFPKEVLTRRFNIGAFLENGIKDLSLYCDLAHENGAPAWIGTNVAEVRRAAVAQLGKRNDSSKLIRLMENWAGIEVRARNS